VTDSGVDWLALIALLVAAYAALISTWKVLYDMRKDQSRLEIYFSWWAEELTVSVVNVGFAPVFIDDAGFRAPEGSSNALAVPFDFRRDGRPVEPLQPKQPIRYPVPAETVLSYVSVGLSDIQVITSDRKPYRKPIPERAIQDFKSASTSEPMA
jgi:hypothetical protein